MYFYNGIVYTDKLCVIRPGLCIKKVQSIYFGFMILNVQTLLQQTAIKKMYN